MVKMVCALDAVLLSPSQAEFTSSTYATRKPDTDEATDAEFLAASGTQGDDTPDALVATDVGQFDLRDGIAIRSGGCSVLCVEI